MTHTEQLIGIIKQYKLNQYDGAAAVVAAKHIETVKGGTFYSVYSLIIPLPMTLATA